MKKMKTRVRKMSRITKSEVLESYAKTGWKPNLGIWIDEAAKECCPIAVIAMSRDPSCTQRLSSPSSHEYISSLLGLDEEYVDGFILGFDMGDFGMGDFGMGDFGMGRVGDVNRALRFSQGVDDGASMKVELSSLYTELISHPADEFTALYEGID